MRREENRATRLLVQIVALALAATACGSGGAEALAYDWTNPMQVVTAEGWMIGPCPGGGDAPLACITLAGVTKGVIEHGSAPVESFAEVPAGASDAEVLDIITSGYLESFRQDRTSGCAAWEFDAGEVEKVQVGQSDGRVVGFSLRRDGSVTEVSETRFAIVDGEVHWLTANALDPRTACLVDPEVSAPTVGEWETIRPGFAALAAGSSF